MSHHTWRWGTAVALVLAVVLGTTGPTFAANVLTARKVDEGPKLTGTLKEVWTQVAPLTIKVVGGKNLPGGTTEVGLRALYTADTVYFLAQWKDPTQSYRRSPWVRQADGSWLKLTDPQDKGGDSNQYYEDKFAMIWNISSPAFEQKGCFSACHVGEKGKPYGNKYTANEGEYLDIWHWKSVRTGPVGQFDNQYVDWTRFDPEKAPEAGRKSDAKTGGGYSDNVRDDKKGPKWAAKGQKPAPPYWILDAEKEPIDDAKYKAGDEVAGIVVAPFTGDRGNTSAAANWENGVWTLEWSRKLVTESKFDVQFKDLSKRYAFGVAVFDNAQVRHAYSPGVYFLEFK